MDDDWFKKFESTKKKNKSIEKRWIIFFILTMFFYFIFAFSFFIDFKSIQLAWIVIILFFILFLIFLFLTFKQSRKKQILYLGDILLYNLFSLSNQIEEYKKPGSEIHKKEILKKIYRTIQEIESIILKHEKQSLKYVYPEFDNVFVSTYKDFIYSINYALIKKKPIPEKLLMSIKNYCNQHVPLIDKYEKENITLLENELAKTVKHFNEQIKKIPKKWKINIFKGVPLFVQLVISYIVISISIYIFFFTVLPLLADFDINTLLSSACLVWVGLATPESIYLWLKSKSYVGS